MARIAGVDLPRGKRIEVALTYIFGIGHSRAKEIIEACGVDPDRRTQDLVDDDVNRIRRQIEGNYKVEGALRTEQSMNIKRLMDIGCYREEVPLLRRALPQWEFFAAVSGSLARLAADEVKAIRGAADATKELIKLIA